ncbi:hypothetical protein C1637_10075 [Chryseobacterium lactis]|uniref:histidine kinase n=2 Tax=Chryseobacterium TaxID=59732 RepID=A0A3G6RF27_CHRLC|nr:sensor histidine kinase [Chryseobacterium lactis]AZA82142.1 sensor histidine kinase [Chryseobacterium lactis]AZB02523.1 sensor histidine kinase [Chryseobacterium lactis]PNW14181.1 hypothetical protein C1637_10075 [Chryseobacterium lactis]
MSKNFSIDARLILQLGRDSIKNHTTALIELIKNSYDADATKVEVEIKKDYIRIADNGFGMSEQEINDNWLIIGFSEKRASKQSEKGRRKTGEKGIGRIATDRLGKIVEIKTKSKKDNIQGLKINWEQFDVEKTPIENIEIEEIDNPILTVPKRADKEISGTEIIITELREQWDSSSIEELYDELSYFVTPLENKKIDFEIDLKNDYDQSFSKKVSSTINKFSEIDIDCVYDGNKLLFTIKDKYFKKPTTKIMEINEIFQLVNSNSETKTIDCGPFFLTISLYIQKSSLLSGSGFKLTDLRDFLNNNSGIKIYRDDIVVKPYGFVNSSLGYDWLGLAERKARDPAGVSRDTYKVSPNQLVGGIFIKRDENENIKDSSNREGLVENAAFKELQNIVLGTVILLESHRVNIINTQKKESKKNSTTKNESIEHITKELKQVKSELRNIEKKVVNLDETSKTSLTKSIETLDSAIIETEETFEKLFDEKRVLNALATLGISSAVFGHETETAVSNFKLHLRNAKEYFDTDPEITKQQLDKAYEQSKLISGWGEFALSRVEREKRGKRKRKISKILNESLDLIEPALEAKSIQLIREFEELYATTYTMDIESIIINLVTNAYTFCVNQDVKRKIRVNLEKVVFNKIAGYRITVSDTGKGIPKEYEGRIFEPLFSTKISGDKKHNGTGLGLTIVKSIVDEMKGTIEVGRDSKLKGAQFKIWLPIEI